MKPKVLIAIPNGDFRIHKQVVYSVYTMLQDQRVESELIMPTFRPITECRQKILYEFLDGDYDFLISIDSDNPPSKSLIDLIFLNLDIVGCPTPIWVGSVNDNYNIPIYLNAMDKHSDGYRSHKPKDSKGLNEVDAIGTGCIIISRRVLVKLKDFQPFLEQLDDRGLRLIGEDFSFCEKAKKAGFKIYAHYGYICNHFTELEMATVIRSFYDYYTKNNPK